jgi:3-dehydrosphinganine reductase
MYDGMQLNYFGALHTARAFASKMLQSGKRGRIVFVSSTVGLMGMVGYSQYSPTKFALRGLAECLNQEFLPYGITFHVYFVASIKTPGYESEQLTKPGITKELEGKDVSGDQSPEGRANVLIEGLKNNQASITSDFFTQLLLATSDGFNLRVKDIPWAIAGWTILPIVRLYFKNTILSSKSFI